MSVIVHFLNGNDASIENHYFQKEYRNDIIIQINEKFYEVYFFVEGSLEYEMRKDGYFSLPGLIILDEISNEKIYAAIDYLIDIGYFDSFVGFNKIPIENTFANKWYENKLFGFKIENINSYVLRK